MREIWSAWNKADWSWLSPCGRYVAVYDQKTSGKSVCVYQPGIFADRPKHLEFVGRVAEVVAMEWSPSSRFLACLYRPDPCVMEGEYHGEYHRTRVVVWNVATGGIVFFQQAWQQPVRALSWSPSSTKLAAVTGLFLDARDIIVTEILSDDCGAQCVFNIDDLIFHDGKLQWLHEAEAVDDTHVWLLHEKVANMYVREVKVTGGKGCVAGKRSLAKCYVSPVSSLVQLATAQGTYFSGAYHAGHAHYLVTVPFCCKTKKMYGDMLVLPSTGNNELAEGEMLVGQLQSGHIISCVPSSVCKNLFTVKAGEKVLADGVMCAQVSSDSNAVYVKRPPVSPSQRSLDEAPEGDGWWQVSVPVHDLPEVPSI